MEATATLCGMCKANEMVRAPVKHEEFVFTMCPNCDSPGGEMPDRRPEDEVDG